MNRQQKRAWLKTHPGENLYINPKNNDEEMVVDRSKATYCWNHPGIKIENRMKPTADDLRRLERIKLKPTKGYDEYGDPVFGRMCPSCFVSIKDNTKIATESDKRILAYGVDK